MSEAQYSVIEIPIEITSGSLDGVDSIANAFLKLGILFEMNMDSLIREWIDRNFPQLTRNLKNVIIDTMVITHDEIRITGSNVYYSQFVEDMVGVNWTSPSTMEQPFNSLKEFLVVVVPEVYVELARQLGLEAEVGF